jgi:acyl carrier protein
MRDNQTNSGEIIMTTINTFEKIRDIICEALYCEKEQVTKDANLIADLGAESIDFLDIVFRLEKAFSIKLPRGDVEAKAREGLLDGEFESQGVIMEKGLARLKQMMPEVASEKFKTGLRVKDLPTLFTVATFERMVTEKLAMNVISSPANASTTVTA